MRSLVSLFYNACGQFIVFSSLLRSCAKTRPLFASKKANKQEKREPRRDDYGGVLTL
jgi:hypothetical protein